MRGLQAKNDRLVSRWRINSQGGRCSLQANRRRLTAVESPVPCGGGRIFDAASGPELDPGIGGRAREYQCPASEGLADVHDDNHTLRKKGDTLLLSRQHQENPESSIVQFLPRGDPWLLLASLHNWGYVGRPSLFHRRLGQPAHHPVSKAVHGNH